MNLVQFLNMFINLSSFFLILFATLTIASVIVSNQATTTNETDSFINSDITNTVNCTWMQKQFCDCDTSFESCDCILLYGCYKNNDTIIL